MRVFVIHPLSLTYPYVDFFMYIDLSPPNVFFSGYCNSWIDGCFTCALYCIILSFLCQLYENLLIGIKGTGCTTQIDPWAKFWGWIGCGSRAEYGVWAKRGLLTCGCLTSPYTIPQVLIISQSCDRQVTALLFMCVIWHF